jgi:hypothetical protein
VQDGRIHLKHEPYRITALAESLHDTLTDEGAGPTTVRVASGTPERVFGDIERVRQVFVHLTIYMLEGCDPADTTVTLHHERNNLVGEIAFPVDDRRVDWRLDLLMGLSEIAPDQVTAEALRPLIARGLISATNGVLTLLDEAGGRRAIRVSIPAEPVLFDQIRVHLETRSEALATIYQAALRSDRVVFTAPDDPEPVDVVLVDNTSVGEPPLMARLRARFPGALFVSLGLPESPDFFDDIVEMPNDMSRLRTSILGKLAS